MKVALSPDSRSAHNPYLARLAQEIGRNGCDVYHLSLNTVVRADVFHFQWPDLIISSRSMVASLRGIFSLLGVSYIARIRRKPIIWTVHNVEPHEAGGHPRLESLAWLLFTHALSGFISLTSAGVGIAEAAHPALRRKPRVVIPHGTYDDAYPKSTAAGRRSLQNFGLEPEEPTLLFFGMVRRYKGVGPLVSEFNKLPPSTGQLVIAGSCEDESLEAEISELAGGSDRIHLLLRHIADTEVMPLFECTTGAVFPFVTGLNSGSVMLALTLRRPVLVPRTPTFDELSSRVGTDWISLYEGDLSAERLESFVAHAKLLSKTSESPDMSGFEWAYLGAQTVNFYHRLLPVSFPTARRRA